MGTCRMEMGFVVVADGSGGVFRGVTCGTKPKLPRACSSTCRRARQTPDSSGAAVDEETQPRGSTPASATRTESLRADSEAMTSGFASQSPSARGSLTQVSQVTKKRHLRLAEDGSVNVVNVNRMVARTKTQTRRAASVQFAIRNVSSVVLPKGFPSAVAPYYGRYAKWHFMHNTITATNAVLATSSLLQAAGVTSGEVPAAVAANWVLKDGVGNFARLLYGNRFAARFDSEIKRFRVLADLLHHTGTAAEILTRVYPMYFLPLAAGGNALKSCAQIIFVSTRATVNRRMALQDNIGEVTAKGDAQSVIADLTGTLVGVVASTATHDNGGAAWLLFSANVCLQMWSRIESLRALEFNTLNFYRLLLLIQVYSTEGVILDPKQLARRERFWKLRYTANPAVRANAHLDEYKDIKKVLHEASACNYLVGTLQSGRVGFSIKEGADVSDIVGATLAAVTLANHDTQNGTIAVPSMRVSDFMAELEGLGYALDRIEGFEVDYVHMGEASPSASESSTLPPPLRRHQHKERPLCTKDPYFLAAGWGPIVGATMIGLGYFASYSRIMFHSSSAKSPQSSNLLTPAYNAHFLTLSFIKLISVSCTLRSRTRSALASVNANASSVSPGLKFRSGTGSYFLWPGLSTVVDICAAPVCIPRASATPPTSTVRLLRPQTTPQVRFRSFPSLSTTSSPDNLSSRTSPKPSTRLTRVVILRVSRKQGHAMH
ncbi:Protein root UVB sensitive 1, chloroplastic [Porphyridium purpureum]|uniref:Protein root UVB sensitive 1, chloroplastic n=1 Tax=Porphyridium purpureum TaxID=35688 RepID=A0A5J4Z9F4_PORPP|nr:Protein root UVB sensitive 1, chloroplastic [Porphyridium purpureum]|eukprot:POR3318..scf295_1